MADYSTHADYMRKVSTEAETRRLEIEKALRAAFAQFIESRPTDVIVFSGMSVMDLSRAIQAQPLVLKPLIATCNIAARAIERDLDIKNVDTYQPVLTLEQAAAIAGYLKPFLPDYLELPALSHLDKVYFVDKEIRKGKGHWEKKIAAAFERPPDVHAHLRLLHEKVDDVDALIERLIQHRLDLLERLVLQVLASEAHFADFQARRAKGFIDHTRSLPVITSSLV